MLTKKKKKKKKKKHVVKPFKVDVPEKYHDRIKTALKNGKKVSVKVSLQSRSGNQTLLLTDGQVRKLRKAKENGKKSATVRLSRRQVEANKRHVGGFLSLIAGLLASAVPAILAGVATSAVSAVIGKSIFPSSSSAVGNGLFLHRRNQTVQVQSVKGGGLYLSPHPPHAFSSGGGGEGIYLKHGNDIYREKMLLQSPWIQEELPNLNILL